MLLRHQGFRKLCHARDLLRIVSEDALTIESIATTVGLSRAHFIRQFEALFGRTPHQYRIEARLDLARQLLARGDRTVTDVCFDVGFSSLGSFSTLFARRVGEPPSSYRRRFRAVHVNSSAAEHIVKPGCLMLMGQLPPNWSFREASSAP